MQKNSVETFWSWIGQEVTLKPRIRTWKENIPHLLDFKARIRTVELLITNEMFTCLRRCAQLMVLTIILSVNLVNRSHKEHCNCQASPKEFNTNKRYLLIINNILGANLSILNINLLITSNICNYNSKPHKMQWETVNSISDVIIIWIINNMFHKTRTRTISKVKEIVKLCKEWHNKILMHNLWVV